MLRLQNEGYDLEIWGGYLLIRNVPYVTSQAVVRYDGILISTLEMSDDVTRTPGDHRAFWTGEHPCHSDGRKIASIENGAAPQQFGSGVKADFTFSAKAKYRDYHHKITTYLGRITGEATKIDPNATAQTFPTILADGDGEVFKYVDTATSRAGIGAVNEKVAGQKIGIIGLGGTGSYVLDLVAKTPVAELHLFDGDVFSQHNAFRSPGAPGQEDLATKPAKVAYFRGIYEKMRNGIIAHDVYMDEDNLPLLDGLDFIFLCADRGPIKEKIVERLVANDTPFVEVGMGVVLVEGRLGGIVRATTCTAKTHEKAAPHISYADGDGGANEYASNIQIAELNAFNAAIAVIQWKKLFGFYQDTREQHYTGFSIAAGSIIYEGSK
ncbi:ThiF family adenylyltransferase [Phaeovulum sp.]|uniref:ThiF family adenylyltransferase n=1 Tax=Phaeovulum sp. TaxID=2934796 RepID=UPI00356A9BF8